MDKTIVGVVGAISGLAALDPAQAAVIGSPPSLPAATSFAELLDPIPNAVALLQAVEAIEDAQAELQTGDAAVTLVGAHHHHRRWWRHHHHHHHHRGY